MTDTINLPLYQATNKGKFGLVIRCEIYYAAVTMKSCLLLKSATFLGLYGSPSQLSCIWTYIINNNLFSHQQILNETMLFINALSIVGPYNILLMTIKSYKNTTT